MNGNKDILGAVKMCSKFRKYLYCITIKLKYSSLKTIKNAVTNTIINNQLKVKL